MNNCKKIFLPAFVFLINVHAIAQTAAATVADEKAGFMRSNGKIFVVMAVVITILAGLILYVLRLDRKISKLEKSERS